MLSLAKCKPLQQRRSCRLNEELKRLRQGRIAQEKTLAAAQVDVKQAQAACQVLLPILLCVWALSPNPLSTS